MGEKRTAEAEDRAANEAATAALGRAKLLAYPVGSVASVDVTEEVVSLLDLIVGTMDWSSGFLGDEQLAGFDKLADLLKFARPDAMCDCGHEKHVHDGNGACRSGIYALDPSKRCPCERFNWVP